MPGDAIAWVDADGTSHDLLPFTSPGLGILVGQTGRFMPPSDLVEVPMPTRPGTVLQHTRVRSRLVEIPLFLQASSRTDLRSRIRQLSAWLDPTRGAGRLRVTAEDGEQRELVAYYQDGLEGEESFERHGEDWYQAIVGLKAPDPYWADVAIVSLSYALNPTQPAFLRNPFFPLQLGSSTVFARTVVTNTGDVEAWPIWTFVGPGTSPGVRNLTTGKFLSIGYTLTAGDRVTVDTRPGVKAVTNLSGSNVFGNLSALSELWPLARGANDLQIELADATTASAVILSYYRRYLSP